MSFFFRFWDRRVSSHVLLVAEELRACILVLAGSSVIRKMRQFRHVPSVADACWKRGKWLLAELEEASRVILHMHVSVSVSTRLFGACDFFAALQQGLKLRQIPRNHGRVGISPVDVVLIHFLEDIVALAS